MNIDAEEALGIRIKHYLRRRSGVSLVELARDIPGFAGDEMWVHHENKVAVWANMSKEAISAMTRLVASNDIEATPSSSMVYAFDGGVLDLPVAKSLTKKYAKPHWFPMVFAGARGSEA